MNKARPTALLIASALTFSAMPVAAQSIDGTARIVLLEELGITKVRDLDFGVVLAGETQGRVDMTPGVTEASCTTNGGILHFDTCQPAVFGGEGSAGQIIRVRLPAGRRITITGPGADMEIRRLMVEAGDDLTRLSPAGSRRNIRYRIASDTGVFLFRMGGRLIVGANQAPGAYEGTFNVQIDYQ